MSDGRTYKGLYSKIPIEMMIMERRGISTGRFNATGKTLAFFVLKVCYS